MKIFVTGLCTLHWGRLQYGNIGNYYIIEPLFRELHRVFPNAEIVTTFQMTEEFVRNENIHILPMDLYYNWQADDLQRAKKEYKMAVDKVDFSRYSTYMKVVKEVSLLVNVSGDMWGDNAEHVGNDRFEVDLLKMRTAQLIGTKTALFAVTPGPFKNVKLIDFAKEVYQNFDLVVNREPISTANMKKWGFQSDRVKDYACPAFLYTPQLTHDEENKLQNVIAGIKSEKLVIGFTIGGFNMPVGPYDMWPREEWQYEVFAQVIEYVVNSYRTKVVLFSHTNGFEMYPCFKLINGRDYPILKQLRDVVIRRGNVQNANDVQLLEGPYLPNMTKSIIGNFDMVITGRVHASVAAISQNVPTIFLDYEDSFIPSTKMYGFANLAGVEELVCEPGDIRKIVRTIDYCIGNLKNIRERLEENIPQVKAKAHRAFDDLAKIVGDI